MQYILGVTGLSDTFHDNSIAILKDGELLFAASQERYSRIKHDRSFPSLAITSALTYLGIPFEKIETIAIGYPRRKMFSVIANRYFYHSIPFLVHIVLRRNVSLIKDAYMLLKEERKQNSESAKKISRIDNEKVAYVDHHLAHAASAYYTSGYDKCVAIALDAFGPQVSGKLRSGAIYIGENGKLKEIMSVPIWASLGLFYQSVTLALGFTPGDGEGKTMGLAAYGDAKKTYTLLRPYAPRFENGRWRKGKNWLAGFFSTQKQYAPIFQDTNFGIFLQKLLREEKKEDIAAAAQQLLEEELANLVSHLGKQYPDITHFALAGGVFLNVKANKKIAELSGVKSVFVHPNAGDGGVALGAAFIASKKIKPKALISAALGESFTKKQIGETLKLFSKEIFYEEKKDVVDYTADLLIKGSVIGWFQGRAEWGPRALGFRSVLADPKNVEIKNRINGVLKNREWFMPFAPSILEEKAGEYFKNCERSPFMTMIFDVAEGKEKKIPAAIHIDNTARPNTVNPDNNILYYKLIQSFYEKTGVPVILNTSFNRHGLPIVNTPKEAIEHLLWGAVDELIIDTYSVKRKS